MTTKVTIFDWMSGVAVPLMLLAISLLAAWWAQVSSIRHARLVDIKTRTLEAVRELYEVIVTVFALNSKRDRNENSARELQEKWDKVAKIDNDPKKGKLKETIVFSTNQVLQLKNREDALMDRHSEMIARMHALTGYLYSSLGDDYVKELQTVINVISSTAIKPGALKDNNLMKEFVNTLDGLMESIDNLEKPPKW